MGTGMREPPPDDSGYDPQAFDRAVQDADRAWASQFHIARKPKCSAHSYSDPFTLIGEAFTKLGTAFGNLFHPKAQPDPAKGHSQTNSNTDQDDAETDSH